MVSDIVYIVCGGMCLYIHVYTYVHLASKVHVANCGCIVVSVYVCVCVCVCVRAHFVLSAFTIATAHLSRTYYLDASSGTYILCPFLGIQCSWYSSIYTNKAFNNMIAVH